MTEPNFDNYDLIIQCEDNAFRVQSNDPGENQQSIVSKLAWVLVVLLKRNDESFRETTLNTILSTIHRGEASKWN